MVYRPNKIIGTRAPSMVPKVTGGYNWYAKPRPAMAERSPYSSPLADAEWNPRNMPSWKDSTIRDGVQEVGLTLEPSPYGMHVVSVTPYVSQASAWCLLKTDQVVEVAVTRSLTVEGTTSGFDFGLRCLSSNGLAAQSGKVRAGDTLIAINGVDLAGKVPPFSLPLHQHQHPYQHYLQPLPRSALVIPAIDKPAPPPSRPFLLPTSSPQSTADAIKMLNWGGTSWF
eukprot:297423-Rhodomonas_salina.3